MIIVGSITGNNNTVAGTTHGSALTLNSQLACLTQPACSLPLDEQFAKLLVTRLEHDT